MLVFVHLFMPSNKVSQQVKFSKNLRKNFSRILILRQKCRDWCVEANAKLDGLLVKFIFLRSACSMQDGLRHKQILYCSSDPSVCYRMCHIKKVISNNRAFLNLDRGIHALRCVYTEVPILPSTPITVCC